MGAAASINYQSNKTPRKLFWIDRNIETHKAIIVVDFCGYRNMKIRLKVEFNFSRYLLYYNT